MLNVLLFSGSNNHDWRQTTPALARILRESGVFAVDVIEEPSVCTAAMLDRYDVIVSNWTNFPSTERSWGRTAEQAVLEFVRSGKGYVVFHGATACFPAWTEFQDLIGATWGQNTGHGRYHRFAVSVADANHPITAGLPGFSMADELWHRMDTRPSAHVLCRAYSTTESGGSGREEPVAFTVEFGRGRCFNLVLGHDVAAMEYPAWRLLMLRGTQWAATGRATMQVPCDIGAILDRIRNYRRGQGGGVLEPIQQLVLLSAGYPLLRSQLATHMKARLRSDATEDCKEYLLEQISLIGLGSDASTLAALLPNPRLGHAACTALERIPGDEALIALRSALTSLEGPALIGVVNSLGQRRDRKAVSPFVSLLQTDDVELLTAIIAALGKIGGPEAVEAIRVAASRSGGPDMTVCGDALLRCADGLAQKGDRTGADEVYEALFARGNPSSIRRAALLGLAGLRGDEDATGEILAAALSSDDPHVRAAAVHCLRHMHGRTVCRHVADRLPSFAESVQPQVVLALAEAGDVAALPGIAKLLLSSNADVRLTALSAIGRLGDASAVPILIRQIEDASELDMDVIRRSLAQMPGIGPDHAILEGLASPSAPRVKRELVGVLMERQSYDSVPVLLTLAAGGDAQLRLAAIKALGVLAGNDHLPALMDSLKSADETRERRAIEEAIVAVARRIESSRSVTEWISRDMRDAGVPARASLLRVLGRLGGTYSLEIVRDLLKDPDPTVRETAVRVLGAWPDAGALAELLAVAREPESPNVKILALRGFADLFRGAQASTLPQWESMAAEAMSLADRAEERRLLLSAFATKPSKESLAIAMSLLGDAELKAEAALASLGILEAVGGQWPEWARSALTQILEAVPVREVTERAEALRVKWSRPANLAPRGIASSPDDLEKDGAAGGDQAGIDGDPATYWDEVDGKSLYRYRVTFAEEVRISALSIMGYQHHSYAPRDFNVLCDGKLVKSVQEAVYGDNVLVVTLPTTSCRTVELEITGRYGPSPAVRELEIYAASE
ncbi:MAG TPA: HEAT repeat domain-containing protein [Sedimentisphaerales bacterium]|nr:HEAT repeat domain-containing protein [Sedimentisphaerales bacterium]